MGTGVIDREGSLGREDGDQGIVGREGELGGGQT